MTLSPRPQLTARQAQVLEVIEKAIRAQGYPPTIREIGAQLGIRSPQGVSDHLAALERKGYLERIPDPSDGRAKLVRITERGLQAWLAGLEAFRELEDELDAVVGAHLLTSLRDGGAALLAFLDHEPAGP